MTIDYRQEPLFGCQNQSCAESVSFTADMLSLHPTNGMPICEYCWDDERREADPYWHQLEDFIPDYEKQSKDKDALIAEQAAQIERLREALKLIRHEYCFEHCGELDGEEHWECCEKSTAALAETETSE